VRINRASLLWFARCPLYPDTDQIPQRSEMTLWADIVAEGIGKRGKWQPVGYCTGVGSGLRRVCGERRQEAEMPDATHAAYLAVSGGGRAIILPSRRRF
jgi:hypothetical protein